MILVTYFVLITRVSKKNNKKPDDFIDDDDDDEDDDAFIGDLNHTDVITDV